jgi:signal transduction histidine kinase
MFQMLTAVALLAALLGAASAALALRGRAAAAAASAERARDEAAREAAVLRREADAARAEAAAAREAAARSAAELRAARDAEERASRATDDIVATVSHELRTPLNLVLGWARLLRQGKLDPAAAARAMETIERSATAQAAVVDDLLDGARIARGELRLDVRPVELVPVVEAALDAVRPAATARGVRLAAVLMPRAGTVSGDAGRLQQVVWNLLANAVKFTRSGGRVEVRLEPAEGHVAVRVRDTGEGIAPELLPRLFEPFRQGDGSATRAHGGLGMGLAIVRRIVEAHGGSVAAESPGPGAGSTFTVRLPVGPARRRAAEDVGRAAQPVLEERTVPPRPPEPGSGAGGLDG